MAPTPLGRREGKVTIKLTGSNVEGGLPLASFETFIENFRRALADFDRQQRGERTKRSGHLTVREELVTAFRLTSVRPGSTVLELEPIAPEEIEDVEQQALVEGELISELTLRSLLDAVEEEVELEPAVTESLSEARRTLGSDGQIAVRVKGRKRHVVIDERRIRRLEERAKRREARPMTVSGRLHRIELEPDKVGIRSPSGVDWTCRYPAELEATVKALLDAIVTARGVGAQLTARRGTLTIEDIRAVPQFEQTAFFTFETVPLDALMARQGVEARRGPISILPEELSEEEINDFLDALDAI